MENTGALLIVGSWGSGKTYYLDNVVFKNLKDSENHFPCIRVSLFGVKDTTEIPYRVFQAYADSTVKDRSSGKIKLDKIRDWAKGIYESIPKLKDLIDLSPLFTKGNAAYSLLPKEMVICFDDVERATETLDINEILGAVNELVENRRYKVILVANKDYIDKRLHFKREDSSDTVLADTERELFYEKVVEKTIAYEPDIVSIYRKLVEGYSDSTFTAFMTHLDQQDIIDPARTKNKNYRRRLQNIRTLKFAIEHFLQIWKMADKANVSETASLNYKILHNYWLFTHAVAIEFKANDLKYGDDRGLSKTLNIIESISLIDNDDETSLFEEEEEEDNDTTTVDTDFVKRFKKRHFESFNEPFVFYQPIYDFLTASKTLDIEALNLKAHETFNVQGGVINPANDILNTLLTKGVWNYTNEDAPQKMRVLFNAIETAGFNDFVSYYNAGIFLFMFKHIIGKTDYEIKTAISKGLELFTKRVPEVSLITKTQISILPTNAENAKWITQEIDKYVDERIKEDNQKNIVELEHKFMTNMAQFAESFAIVPGRTPAFFQVPILESMNLSNVTTRLSSLEPADVMHLCYFINCRYLSTDCENYVSELPFLESISKGILTIDKEEPLLSNYIIERFLRPSLEKALRRLNKLAESTPARGEETS